MRRSVWIAGLKEMLTGSLGMPEFEAGKAAELAADHARGPWDAERVVVPESLSTFFTEEPVVASKSTKHFTVQEAQRAAEILNGYENARGCALLFGPLLKGESSEVPVAIHLRAFFQIEEE